MQHANSNSSTNSSDDSVSKNEINLSVIFSPSEESSSGREVDLEELGQSAKKSSKNQIVAIQIVGMDQYHPEDEQELGREGERKETNDPLPMG